MHISSTSSILKAALLSVLRQEMPVASVAALEKELPSYSDASRRRLLGDVLIASNTHWKEETLKLIDEIYKEESDVDSYVSWKDAVDGDSTTTSYKGTKAVSVWRGDITKLKVDAIVNAANDQGLGCFVPDHRCIDNVIHRQAGPRLRLACREATVTQRHDDDKVPLAAGKPPIVTSGFHLPSKHVIHVTGPQIQSNLTPTSTDRDNLAKAYKNSLDAAAARNIRSIAFPCISTGLFGFPKELAAEIALSAVKDWLDLHPSEQLDAVIFDVFTADDEEIYSRKIGEIFPTTATPVDALQPQSLRLAKRWIENANAVLICAGAGMSVKEGEMVYTNPDDFARHYPWFTKWGYQTAYQAMGLGSDRNVPAEAKWAFSATHMDNMRWKFAPNEGYQTLLDLVKDKNYFVLTSNVDGCFERSGFLTDRIYTPQGEWTFMQCKTPCRPDSVFESRPILDKILPSVSDDGYIPDGLIPKCPNCGGPMFGNVRGGSWFLQTKYEEQNLALQQWMTDLVDSEDARVVVIEIGAGFNTPSVTRFPVESFARALGERGRFIRINPDESAVPSDVKAISLTNGWQVLKEIAGAQAADSEDMVRLERVVDRHQKKHELTSNITHTVRHYFGHFDWRMFLNQLRE